LASQAEYEGSIPFTRSNAIRRKRWKVKGFPARALFPKQARESGQTAKTGQFGT
jgi:hypothetical protein